MTCPSCHAMAEPALTVQGVSVCARCGMTVMADGGMWRQATFADIEPLSAAELLQLRKASAPLARPGRR